MVNSSRFAFDPRIDKPWGSTLREKLPRSVRLQYVNWCFKKRQQGAKAVPVEVKETQRQKEAKELKEGGQWEHTAPRPGALTYIGGGREKSVLPLQSFHGMSTRGGAMTEIRTRHLVRRVDGKSQNYF